MATTTPSSAIDAGVKVEGVEFPPKIKPPGSTKTLFLGGAGVRGLPIQGNFVKFTAIGVYLEDHAVPSLAVNWKAKTADELMQSPDFFMDIVKGPFEKFTKTTLLVPLTGQEFSAKVAGNCVAYMKSVGIYGDAEAKGIEEFLATFKEEDLSPGSSILFTQSPKGSLTISFSKDGIIPEVGKSVIENQAVSEALLESIIGQNGISPAAKKSLAARLSEKFKESYYDAVKLEDETA